MRYGPTWVTSAGMGEPERAHDPVVGGQLLVARHLVDLDPERPALVCEQIEPHDHRLRDDVVREVLPRRRDPGDRKDCRRSVRPGTRLLPIRAHPQICDVAGKPADGDAARVRDLEAGMVPKPDEKSLRTAD